VVAPKAAGPALYTIPADGGAMQRLAIGNAPGPSEPDWSAGRQVSVFTVNRGGFEICVAPMEGLSAERPPLWRPAKDPVWGAQLPRCDVRSKCQWPARLVVA